MLHACTLVPGSYGHFLVPGDGGGDDSGEVAGVVLEQDIHWRLKKAFV